MNSLVEGKLDMYLRHWLHVDYYDCGVIISKIRFLAEMAGHDLDDRFRHAGMGAGPEARVAAGIVDRACLGGGCETSDYTIRQHLDQWVRSAKQIGKL